MNKATIIARINEIKEQQAAKDLDIANLRGKVDSIKALVDNLGTLPTLTKFREFLTALKTLIEEAAGNGAV